MSEVALVAAITGGASVLTSGVTAAVTWAVSRNSSSVELAKVAAENERLLQSAREDERRNRQATYHKFIDAFRGVFQILGVKTPEDVRREKCEAFNHLLGGVLLFGPPTVQDGAYDLNEVYEKIWPALRSEVDNNPEKPYMDSWRDVTSPLKEDFSTYGSVLISRMHSDVTHGIVKDPEYEGSSA